MQIVVFSVYSLPIQELSCSELRQNQMEPETFVSLLFVQCVCLCVLCVGDSNGLIPINVRIQFACFKQVQNVLWTRKGVRATVVTASHCTQAELTSGHALASCYSCYVHSLPGLF